MANENQQNIHTGSDEISLKELILKIRELWRYLLSKWLIILIFALLGGALGFTYAYFKKPVYTATTTFVLEDEKSGGGGLGSLAGLAAIAGVDLGGTGGGIFQGDNILELYKSRSMIQKTLLTAINFKGKKKLLVNYYIEFNNLNNKWAKNATLKNLKFGIYDSTDYSKIDNIETSKMTRLQDSILGDIVNDINTNYMLVMKPDKKLNIIRADVKGEDEFFAAAFNREIVRNVNNFYIETKTRKTLDNINILQSKTDSVRAAMNGAIYAAASVADATPNLNPTRQVQRIAPMQRSQFTIESNKLVLSSLLQNLEIAKMALLKEKPLIQVIDQPVFPLLKDRTGKISSLLFGSILAGFLCIFFLLLGRFLIYVKNL